MRVSELPSGAGALPGAGAQRAPCQSHSALLL